MVSNEIKTSVATLINRARDAMPGGGLLMISTVNCRLTSEYVARHSRLRAGDYILIEISDTGEALKPDVVALVASPTSVLTKQPDLRVSELCTVADFARECGGYLDVYAEAQVGTTFRLYLPRAGDAPKDEQRR